MSALWHGLLNWFASMPWNQWGVWAMTLVLLSAGLLGSFVPLVPGPLIIFIACALHTWLRPVSGMGIWGLVLEFLLVVLAYVLDFASGAMGSRWFGGSRWGIVGVFLGLFVGMFFSIPGLILGPVVGGLAFELGFAGKEVRPAIKATWGSVLGMGLGLLARGGVGVLMVVLFFVFALWR